MRMLCGPSRKMKARPWRWCVAKDRPILADDLNHSAEHHRTCRDRVLTLKVAPKGRSASAISASLAQPCGRRFHRVHPASCVIHDVSARIPRGLLQPAPALGLGYPSRVQVNFPMVRTRTNAQGPFGRTHQGRRNFLEIWAYTPRARQNGLAVDRTAHSRLQRVNAAAR